jgi:hypothetical protein
LNFNLTNNHFVDQFFSVSIFKVINSNTDKMGFCFSTLASKASSTVTGNKHDQQFIHLEEVMYVLDPRNACCYGCCFGSCKGCCARKTKCRLELKETDIIWRLKDGTLLGRVSIFATGFDLEMAMIDDDEIGKDQELIPPSKLYIRIMPRNVTIFPPNIESRKKWIEAINKNKEVGSSTVQGLSARAETRAKESLNSVLDNKIVRAGVSAGVTVGAGMVGGPVAAMAAPAITEAGFRGLKQELGLTGKGS